MPHNPPPFSHGDVEPPPISALVYSVGDPADQLLAQLAGQLKARGVRLAGLVQHALSRPGYARCQMEAEILPSGRRVRLSEDRGRGARGCHLDQGLLLEALVLAEHALPQADLLILNRFGKTEAQGGGGRDLIAQALTLKIPVVVAVSWRNIAPFRAFAAGLAQEFAVHDFQQSINRLAASSQRHGAGRTAWEGRQADSNG